MTDLLQEAMDVFGQVDTLRLRGIRVWSETIERVAGQTPSELASAYEQACRTYIAVKDETDPIRIVEAYAEMAAFSICLWSRGRSVQLALADFVADLEGAVLWANCRNPFPTH